MENFNKILSEELNKIQYILGYKRGVVISEQTQLTKKQKEASDAGWGPVTDEYAKKLPVGRDGKILPNKTKSKTNSVPSTNVKLTIRQLIEKDINIHERTFVSYISYNECMNIVKKYQIITAIAASTDLGTELKISIPLKVYDKLTEELNAISVKWLPK